MTLPEKLFFAGAGGIGMAALERYFLARGCRVAGYDRTPTPLTDALIAEGAEITFDDSPGAIPGWIRRSPEGVTVVYTPALPDDHPQLQWFGAHGYSLVKRAKVLGLITETSRAICFAGTHGKTTTSSMAAHLMHSLPCGCSAFLGGVLRNYGTNFLLNPSSPWCVAEADEYDRSFHHLRPQIAVITATDPDHLDIYGTEEAYLESFAHFTSLVRPGGALVLHEGMKLKPRPQPGVTVYTYSRHRGHFHAANIRRGEGTVTFDFVHPGGVIEGISPGVPVDINIDNALAALAAVWLTGELNTDTARTAMASFMGPERRFQMRLRQTGPRMRVVIDDYAHHPDELRASISSVRALYPGRRLTVVFQPHLYSRTRDFAPGFAAALSLADQVILLPIYPARELPMPGVTSAMIFDAVTAPDKVMVEKCDLTNTIKISNFDVLLTAGAGDISAMLPAIVEAAK